MSNEIKKHLADAKATALRLLTVLKEVKDYGVLTITVVFDDGTRYVRRILNSGTSWEHRNFDADGNVTYSLNSDQSSFTYQGDEVIFATPSVRIDTKIDEDGRLLKASEIDEAMSSLGDVTCDVVNDTDFFFEIVGWGDSISDGDIKHVNVTFDSDYLNKEFYLDDVCE